MNFGSKRDKISNKSATLDITPLIDMVFLLLIFFLIATTFENVRRINVKLPSAETGTKVVKNYLTISIDKEGNVYLNKKPISISELENYLKGLDNNEKKKNVYINGDQDCPYSKVILIMDILRKHGFENIGLGVKSY